MTKTVNVPSYYDKVFANALGFDCLLDLLYRTSDPSPQPNNNFPPVNILRDNEDGNKYIIELAVSGFSSDEIRVEVERNSLKVLGKKSESETDNRRYIMHGIAYRSFIRSFVLASSIVVKDAVLANGILSVYLENVIPEEHKPRLVKIKTV